MAKKTPEKLYDGHIHMPVHNATNGDITNQKANALAFAERAKQANVTGGLVISCPPFAVDCQDKKFGNRQRMASVVDFCSHLKDYYPCYWINPTARDACKQVADAKEMGIRALKVICSTHHPADGLECYRMAAQLDLPILFHSGSLWDDRVSADFNRPANWECMLDVYNTRFCLAHISWPWQSECLALFGKLNQANFRRNDIKCDIYLDCSPGTPEIDREDIFRRFVLLGYSLENKLIWGVDSSVDHYSVDYAKWIYSFDKKMFADLQKKWGNWKAFRCEGSFMAAEKKNGGDAFDFKTIFENATKKNLLRFLGEKV